MLLLLFTISALGPLSLRIYTGSGAATESGAQTGIFLCTADALTGGSVVPGSVSYERWIRLRVDTAGGTVTNFSIQNTGSLPAGVSIKFGVTDTPVTPVNTVSTIATMDLTAGRAFIFDTTAIAAVGDHTRYLVLQEVVASTAVSGAIPQQSLAFGFVEG